jgi:hypothetical protein
MKAHARCVVLVLVTLLVVSALVCGGLALPASAAGAAYYVDCAAGDDAADGLSPATAWRTTTRANQQAYGPGDQILFMRDAVCTGDGFKPTGSGTEAEPITIADYGTGALPAIDGVGPSEPALLLRNVQNYVVRNLDLTHQGQTPCTLDANHEESGCPGEMVAIFHIQGEGPVGVPAETCGEACTVRNVLIEDVKIHDGSWNGIYMIGGHYSLDDDVHGYVDNITIRRAEVWNVHKNGIEASCTYYKTPIYHATNIQTFDSYAHDNGGDGIVYGPAAHVVIDGCETPYNGQLRDARLGAWTWDSLDTTIQFNESHHNMTPATDKGARDGGGFDLDLGTEDGMIQYNWSHDNEGEGFLLMAWPIGYGFKRGKTHNAQMRYNLGERDGYKLAAGIEVFGGVDPAVIYNNVIYYEPDRTDASEMPCHEGAALCSEAWGQSGSPKLHVYNNIFVNNGTVNPSATSSNVWSDNAGTFWFDNNIWWRVEGGVRFAMGPSVIDTWAGWQAAGYDPNGMNADPLVVGPLGGGPAAYKLQSGSPAIDAGRDVTEALRGMGTRDYFGVSIPQGAGYDIGMAEYEGGGPPPTDTPEPEPTWTPTSPTITPPPGVLHVGDIAMSYTQQAVFYRAVATVTILDAGDMPVEAATVYGEFSGATSDAVADDTAGDGTVTLQSSKVKNGGTWTFCVTSVVKSGWTYDEPANVETCDTITVP